VQVRRFAQDGTQLSDTYTPGPSQVVKGTGIAALPGNNVVAVWAHCSTYNNEPCPHQVSGAVIGSDGRQRHYVPIPKPPSGAKQTWPRVDSFGDGSFVIVYQADHQDGDDFGVVARHYSATAQDLSERQVNVDWTGAQMGPDVAVLSDTDYVVAFRDAAGEVWTRRFRRDGSSWTGRIERAADDLSGLDQRMPSAGVTKTGEVLVAWQGPSVHGGDDDIVARLFDADGVPRGEAMNLSGNDDVRQAHPSVAGHDDGFVVVWDERSGRHSPRTKALRLDARGDVVQGPFDVQVSDYPVERRSHVDARPDGSFVVAWVAHASGNPHCEAQAYTALGGGLGAGGVVAPPHEAGFQGSVRVAAHPTRGSELLVAYDFSYGGRQTLRLARYNHEPRMLGDYASLGSVFGSGFSVDVSETGRVAACWVAEDATVDLYCQILDYDSLTPVGDRFAAPGPPESNQRQPRVAWMHDGNVIAAWTDSRADGDGTSILVRSFNGEGEPRDPRRVANRTWAGDQSLGFLVSVGLNRLWLGWTDNNDGARVRYRALQRF